MIRLFSLLTVLYCILVTIDTCGQIRFGFNTGINLTTLHNDDNSTNYWDQAIGYRVGGVIEKPFGKLGLRLGAYYSYAHVKGLFDDKIRLHYISLPTSFFYRPINQLGFYIGPEINILLNQTGPKYKRSFGDDYFEKLDYGIHIELEFNPIDNLGVSVRNYFGLQYNEEALIDINSSKTGLRNRLNILTISLTYYLSAAPQQK